MIEEILQIDLLNGTRLNAALGTTDEKLDSEKKSTLVVMVHDLPYSHSRDHDDLFGHVRNIFDEYGFQTLLFDFPSCGDSNGKEEDLTLESARQTFKEVLVWAQKRGIEKFIFVTSGVAAALALEFANDKIKMLFLFWPAVDLALHAQTLFYEDMDGGKRLVAKGRKLSHDLIEQMENYDVSRTKKTLKIPILIHYGALDTNISPDHVDMIRETVKAPRIDVTSYADGGHGLTDPRHRKMMAHHLSAFLDKYS